MLYFLEDEPDYNLPQKMTPSVKDELARHRDVFEVGLLAPAVAVLQSAATCLRPAGACPASHECCITALRWPCLQYLEVQKKLFDAKQDAGFRKVGSGTCQLDLCAGW